MALDLCRFRLNKEVIVGGLLMILICLLVVGYVGWFVGVTVDTHGFLQGWFQSFGFKEHLSEVLAAALMLALIFTTLWTLTLFGDDPLSFGEFVCFVLIVIPCLLLLLFPITLLWGGVAGLHDFFEGWFQRLGLWWPIPFILSLALTVGSLFGALVALLVGCAWTYRRGSSRHPKVPDLDRTGLIRHKTARFETRA